MLRLRTEGIVAAAGASGFILIDPNPGFASRANLIALESATYANIFSGLAFQPAQNGMALLHVGGSVSTVNGKFESYISALEDNHPIVASGFEILPWMITYMRFKDVLDSSKFTRFRNQMVLWNTTAQIDPITKGGRTPNQQWLNATAGILVGEEWAGFSSAVDSRYSYLVNSWLPAYGERIFKRGYHEYNSANYQNIQMQCFEALRQFSTNANVRAIAKFLLEQQMIMSAHHFALGQYAVANQRSVINFFGTPRYPMSYEHMLWLMFDGEEPHHVWEGSGEQAWEEFSWCAPIYTSTTFSVPDYAWRINQAAHQQTHTLREKHESSPVEEDTLPNHEWPVVETYTRANKKYAVSRAMWPNGMNVPNETNPLGEHHGQSIKWAVTWSSTGSQMSQFRVSHNDDTSYYQDDGSHWFYPISTIYSTIFGSEGVVVEAYNLPGGQTDLFIQGFEPDQVQASSTSGNWRFLHMPNILIACYFTAGFSIQSPKQPIFHSGDAPSFTRPWYRSPGTGTAQKLGVVVETAAPEDYSGGDAATRLSNFASAVTASRGGVAGGVDDSQIGASQPQITYHALNGQTYVCQYMGVKSIDGVPFDWNNAKRLESPWVQQDYGGDDMFVTDPGTGQVIRYRWSDKSITQL